MIQQGLMLLKMYKGTALSNCWCPSKKEVHFNKRSVEVSLVKWFSIMSLRESINSYEKQFSMAFLTSNAFTWWRALRCILCCWEQKERTSWKRPCCSNRKISKLYGLLSCRRYSTSGSILKYDATSERQTGSLWFRKRRCNVAFAK